MDATGLTQEQAAELVSRVVEVQRLYTDLADALDDDRARADSSMIWACLLYTSPSPRDS